MCQTASVIHSAVCLTTVQQPPPKRVLHTVQSSASCISLQHSLVYLTSSSSYLRLLPCLPIASIPSSTTPSIICFRRQFLRKMWLIQLVFLLFILCRIFVFFLIRNTSSFLTRLVQLIFSFIFSDLLYYIYFKYCT